MDERIKPDAPLYKVGYKTPSAVIYKHESHKLHQSFTVATDSVTNLPVIIFQGNPVKLMPDGTIDNYNDGDTDGVYIGIAMTDSPTPAYTTPTVEVTVAVIGYMIIRGQAAADGQDAGYVVPTAVDAATAYYNYAAAAANTPSQWIAILPGDEGDLIDILVLS